MTTTLQIICVILVAVTMVPALAHALEVPGKRRLEEKDYLAVQTIYYPGFTFAGFAEPAAGVATLILLLATPRGTTSFWLTLVAALALACVHAVYWLVTHPANKVWMQRQNLGGAGARFFSSSAGERGPGERSWTELRDRWEQSHIVRAGLALVAFVTLVIALSPAG